MIGNRARGDNSRPGLSAARGFAAAVLGPTLLLFGVLASAQSQVQLIRGRQCVAAGPAGWSVTAENATGAAFGADLARQDGAALASYLIAGVPPDMRSSPYYQQWYATPEQAVMAQLTQFGTRPASCDSPVPLDIGSGYMTASCRSPGLVGLVAYKVFDMGNGGYVLLMRTAGAPDASWSTHGAEATAVARSIRCEVPLISRGSSTELPSSSEKRRNSDDESDSEYSPWLGMETYHDASTGQNYWVSPSSDWNETGPRGPGYYVGAGNDIRKLEPGMAQ